MPTTAELSAPAQRAAGVFDALLGRLRRARGACVALQWQGEALALARITAEGGMVSIDSLQRIDVPAAARSAAIRRLQRDGVLRGAQVHLLLAPGDYEIQQVAAPAVPEEELRAALRWHLRGALAYPAEEAVVDYLRIPDPEGAPARNQLLAITAQRARVTRAAAPLLDAGVVVASVDVPEFAQRNLTSFCTHGARGTQAWLSFDQDTCLFTVNHDTALVFARRMLMPAAQEAESGADADRRLAERIVVQVQRSLELFERGSGLPQVGNIAIGPHAAAAAIAQELTDRTAVRSTVVEQLAGFANSSKATRLARELAGPLGLALRAVQPESE